MPLEQVESIIKQTKHLPGIPPASKIESEGLPLGEINRQMMEKIEELTLYLIQQEKRINELEKENRTVKKMLDE